MEKLVQVESKDHRDQLDEKDKMDCQETPVCQEMKELAVNSVKMEDTVLVQREKLFHLRKSFKHPHFIKVSSKN